MNEHLGADIGEPLPGPPDPWDRVVIDGRPIPAICQVERFGVDVDRATVKILILNRTFRENVREFLVWLATKESAPLAVENPYFALYWIDRIVVESVAAEERTRWDETWIGVIHMLVRRA